MNQFYQNINLFTSDMDTASLSSGVSRQSAVDETARKEAVEKANVLLKTFTGNSMPMFYC